MRRHLLRPIFATLYALIAQAQRHTPGGTLLPDDMAGLYRRAARAHGCTSEDLQRWHEARGAPKRAGGMFQQSRQ